MKLSQRQHNGKMWWFVDFERYQSFGVGRVQRMPTVVDAMRIVNGWKLRIIDGRPFYFDAGRNVWCAYGNNNLIYVGQ